MQMHTLKMSREIKKVERGKKTEWADKMLDRGLCYGTSGADPLLDFYKGKH